MEATDNPFDYATDPHSYLIWDEKFVRAPLCTDDELRKLKRLYSEEWFEVRLGDEWRKRGLEC